MRSSEVVFTERELDVMNVLWQDGSGTAGEIRKALEERSGILLAVNTVQTVLGILKEKGRVRHVAQGRAHRYYPAVPRTAAKASAVRRLVRTLFDGSASLLVTQLVADRSLSKEEVQKIRDVVRKSTSRAE
ncbi:MAG: BlaI/MecI/CopY family transcriptional regulator [Gemmatimonadota bacterium]|nr:BlaI/MecI/CopY family transcriptional regulator [Gemmatimonadota bacterium]